MKRPRLLLALGLLGCAASQTRAPCTKNSDCPGNEVCFVDGCGDPGKDIIIEVIPTGTDQAYPQQIAISDLEGTEDVQLSPPSILAFTLLQDTAAVQGGAVPYTGLVSLLATGFGPELPDSPLSYQAVFAPDAGAHALEVASGAYTVSAYPHDVNVPPVIQQQTAVPPAEALPLTFTFPSSAEWLTVSGLLERTSSLALDVAMSVQAFTAGNSPLSQRVPVTDGGSFSLNLTPSAGSESMYVLDFEPADPGALAPQKAFNVMSPPGPDAGTFDLGDYGAALVVQGELVDRSGQPVGNAAVHIEGMVAGGGTFRSGAVQTDSQGAFSLGTLPGPSGPSAGLTLIAIPPQGSSAGLLQAPVAAGPDLGTLTCPDRPVVLGAVLLPDGVSPAAGVQVTATPVAPAAQGQPLPAQGAKAVTDHLGAFSLALDPAAYRIDLVADPSIPWASAFVLVDGSTSQMSLPATVLSHGREVGGTVTWNVSGQAQPASLAVVRFYRKVEGLGALRSIPLAQSFTDAQGHYSALIPTR